MHWLSTQNVTWNVDDQLGWKGLCSRQAASVQFGARNQAGALPVSKQHRNSCTGVPSPQIPYSCRAPELVSKLKMLKMLTCINSLPDCAFLLMNMQQAELHAMKLCKGSSAVHMLVLPGIRSDETTILGDREDQPGQYQRL